MVFKITTPINNPVKLTQSVLQITEMLDLYKAELARVLHFKCVDIRQLSNASFFLEPGSDAWEQAVLFVRAYELLFTFFDGDGVAMCHWLRVQNKDLDGTPLLIIVDEGQLEMVVLYLEDRINKDI